LKNEKQNQNEHTKRRGARTTSKIFNFYLFFSLIKRVHIQIIILNFFSITNKEITKETL
jgi:hypothetical protein